MTETPETTEVTTEAVAAVVAETEAPTEAAPTEAMLGAVLRLLSILSPELRAAMTFPVDAREWPNPTTQHQAFVKFDNQVTSQQAISGRYRIDRNLTEGSGIGGLNTHDRGGDNMTRDQDGVVSDTYVISNHALNELRFQASQRYNNSDTSRYSPIGTPAIARPSGNFGKAIRAPRSPACNKL